MKSTRHTLAKLTLAAVLGLAATSGQAAQTTFSTPQAAADALIQAVATGDDDGLRRVLGDDFRHFVPRDSIDRDDIYAFLAAWFKKHRIVDTGPNTAEFVVGEHDWSFPAPLVSGSRGWRFDLRAGVAEMQHRRIERNEAAAIANLRRLCAAQDQYRATVGNGQPARRIVSREGEHDGLYWNAASSPSATSPLDDDALVMGADVPVDAALNGYRFAYVPTAEPSGCSFAAWPAEAGRSGLHSFLIGPHKVVSERRFGAPVTERQVMHAANDKAAWAKISP
ncbi:DUF2950 family protein [Achromobacter arsenitoxydans]|uniref:DUF2950 domain-containing protein n=1 Tax=Achromobacter arsenitoxydans SY8 TaxID=477184 RepID=H0F892_9BURK|nr:DUF2950 family protein [Achromobacter arsenitoxydans]EHK65525.1 hypothetical protein KYC_14952 [Achromobacter arsenitoxydans SY8]